MRNDWHDSISSDALLARPWLTAILDEIPVAVAFFDQWGQLVHGNRQFAENTQQNEASMPVIWQAYSEDGHRLDDHVFPCVRIASEASPAASQQRRPDNQTQLQCFAENSSSAMLIVDVTSGKIDFFSPAAQRIWEAGPHLAAVSDWEASVHPEDRAGAMERRALVSRGFMQSFQYRITDKRGEVTHLLRETAFPMPSSDGRNETIGCIIEDISPHVPVYLVAPPQSQDAALFHGLRLAAQRVTTFSSEQELMNVANVLNPGCVVIDLRATVPSLDSLVRLLHLRPRELQIILLGAADTSSQQVIAALKAGAADYLIEPMTSQALSDAIHEASQSLMERSPLQGEAAHSLGQRLANLPPREREVFVGLINGGTNKSIARALKLSPRTVETHRAHLMQRLNVKTLTDLLHLARDSGFKSPQASRP